MLKLGEKIISDIYLGDKKIAKVFLGDKLVYQANKPIFLDYIDSDGNNCIDSGIECTSDLKIEFKGSCSDNTNQACCGGIGLQNAPIYFRYHWTPAGGMFGFWCQNDAKMASINGNHPMGRVAEATIDAPNGIAIVNGTKYTFTKLEKGLTTGKNFGVFGRISSKGDIQSKPSRFYYFKIYKNDILMRDLRPCIDPKGVVCMYDMVTQKYHYNIGTGTLKAGGRFVESIVFDGASYIDTLFKPHPHTTRTVLDCMLLDNTSSGGQGVFGSRPASVSSINSMNIWFNTSDAPKTLRLDCTGNYQITKPDAIDITQRLLIDCLDKDATINGVTYSSTVDKSNTTYLNYSMYLGNFNNVGTPYTKGCKMNVYGFTIYDNGVLFQDLRPYVDENGTACFKDIVTGKLFYNQGTGKLGYKEN